MKKALTIISIFAFVAVMFVMASTTAGAADIIASGECGAEGYKVTWALYSDGLLVIDGEGKMKNFLSPSSVPWDSLRTQIKSVEIKSGITEIRNYTFYNCYNIDSVFITDVAAWCGISFSTGASNPLTYAHKLYLNNELVTDLVIPDTVTSISDLAFTGGDFTSVEIPSSVTSIGEGAFRDCKSITSIEIPSSVTKIGVGAFAYSDLISIEIPSSVTSVEDSTFYNCINLSSIKIPSSVTSIGDYAFAICENLNSIIIPASVTSMGNNAFYCSSLHTIHGYFGSYAETYASSHSLNFVEIIPGDVNSDGEVNNKDVSRLFQYLSDWNVDVKEIMLDINGDGKVNNRDLTRLFQYVSGWDVLLN